MLRYIWNSWRRNKSRLLLLLIGVLILSSGLSFLVGLAESNKEKIDKRINSWKPSYHILVRAQGTRSITEEDGLIDPNYITGLNGGISSEHWNKIKEITNVEVAAPLANIGYVSLHIVLDKIDFRNKNLKDGIYRFTAREYSPNNIYGNNSFFLITYGYKGDKPKVKNPLKQIRGSIVPDFQENYSVSGVDPEEEAKLVGLEQAVSQNNNLRYFNRWDQSSFVSYISSDDPDFGYYKIPVLGGNNLFRNQEYIYTIERLNLEEADNIDLDKITSVDNSNSYTYNFKINEMKEYLSNVFKDSYLFSEPSISTYKTITSPFISKWSNAYEVETKENQRISELPFLNFNDTFKPINKIIKFDRWIVIEHNYIGTYETDKLNLDKDPIMNLPLDIYRPATGKLILDADGKPLNPPVTIKQNNNPFGFINNSPHLLTTIEAASKILGEKPISAIRVKVKDVVGMSEENQQKIKQVAEEIEQQTGLMTDIIYGASPQPVLVYVPENGDTPALGWVEEVWMKLGNATTIFNEFTTSYTGTFYSIFLVPLIYIIATSFIFYLTRKKEFALLLATGWKTKSLIQMIFIESGLIGLLMTFTAWGILGIVSMQQDMIISLPRFLLIGLLAFFIAITGSILPSIIVSRITPYQAMKTGEISKRKTKLLSSKHALTMAITGFFSRIQRNILSILSIAIPTMLLIYYLFISNRLEGILYTSWLGKYVAMEVGPIHYITIIVALILSILTTAQIMLQNVEERKSELSLLKALGWRNSTIRKLIISEGFFLGVSSAITGLIFGLLMIVNIYHQFPTANITIYLAAGMIPLLVGTISAILPAEKAARQAPLKGIHGSYSTNKATFKFFSYILAILGMVIFISASISTIHVVHDSIMLSKQVETPILEQTDHQTREAEAKRELEEKLKNVGNMSGFVPKGVSNENKGTYDIDLMMDEQGTFQVNAKIKVQNLSDDIWDKTLFYFIPYVFTKENKERLGEQGIESYADVSIKEVKVDGKKENYNLDYDTLAINHTMQPKEVKTIEITYSFTVPERGIRFTKENENYYLAQWYPMLATYREGKWNKEDYLPVTESYHTDFSDYTVRYSIPDGYTLVSSADQDAIPNQTEGEIKANKIKDFFIYIFKDIRAEANKEKLIESNTIDGIEVRVIGGNKELQEKVIGIAIKAVDKFNTQIGLYPNKQLDVIIGGGGNMEYSGIVTITIPEDNVITHEIGHQWFYGVISDDPYHNGWLDEGITELATGLSLYDDQQANLEESFRFGERKQRTRGSETYSNLTINNYQNSTMTNLYDRPVVKLWKLFEDYGGIEAIGPFLKEYYNQYAFKEVDTEEFVRFTKAYFHLNDNKYFEDWLKLD